MEKSRNPYHVIRSRYVTEKTTVLEGLKGATSNRCIAKYELPKYVFLVDKKANKSEIRRSIETIYPSCKVKSVNTITIKPKKRRVRGFRGFRPGIKKAVVTLEKGDLTDG